MRLRDTPRNTAFRGMWLWVFALATADGTIFTWGTGLSARCADSQAQRPVICVRRLRGGEIDNLAEGLQDPKALQEAVKALQDPATLQRIKAMMEDPEFMASMKQYAEQITKDPQFEQIKKQTEQLMQDPTFIEQMTKSMDLDSLGDMSKALAGMSSGRDQDSTDPSSGSE